MKQHLTVSRKLIGALIAALSVFSQSGAAGAQEPNTASGWQSLFFSTSSSAWDGADQNFSYLASNGVTYWCHGDTVLGTNNASGGLNGGWTMVGNTILAEKNGVISKATAAYPSVPDNPVNHNRYWADGMFEANGGFYVLALEAETNGVAGTGTRLAKFQINANATLTFLKMVDTPNTNNPGNGTGPANVLYANDALVVGQYVYVFGQVNTGNNFVPLNDYVARIPTASIESPSAWTYWNGSSWVSGMANAAKILDDGITCARYLGGSWVLTHKPFGPYANDVYAEVGPNPYGPWTSTKIFTAPGVSGQALGLNYVTYYPQFHPEKWLASGKLLFSISHNDSSWPSNMVANAAVYKPVFYEISLSTNTALPLNTPLNFICKSSGEALDNAASTSWGTTVTQYSQQAGNVNQQWRLVDAGAGYYNIISVKSGFALDNTGATTSGAVVVQYPLQSGNAHQLWQVTSVGGGYYDVVCKKSGMTLDNAGSASPGAAVTQYTIQSGNAHQFWQIVPAR